MRQIKNTSYRVQAEEVIDEDILNIEEGAIYINDFKLKVQLKGEIKEIRTMPYKVYTALLTQGGNSNGQTIYSGALTNGVSYSFGPTVNGGTRDFSNVGGPVHPDSYPFVATSSNEPNSWDGVDGLDYNTGVPVAKVLENTLNANLVWYYYAPGIYYAESYGTWKTDKTGTFVGPLQVESSGAYTQTIFANSGTSAARFIKTSFILLSDSIFVFGAII